MRGKNILMAALLAACAWQRAEALMITDFGDSDFAVDAGTSSFPLIATHPSEVEVAGTDFGEILAGTFQAVDIAGLDLIRLTGHVTGTSSGSAFTVLLFDPTFTMTREYSGFLSDFGGPGSAVFLSFVAESASFSEIAGFQFVGGGFGSPFHFTFENLEAVAVPEPQTPWLLLGALGAGVWMRIRSRATR